MTAITDADSECRVDSAEGSQARPEGKAIDLAFQALGETRIADGLLRRSRRRGGLGV